MMLMLKHCTMLIYVVKNWSLSTSLTTQASWKFDAFYRLKFKVIYDFFFDVISYIFSQHFLSLDLVCFFSMLVFYFLRVWYDREVLDMVGKVEVEVGVRAGVE